MKTCQEHHVVNSFLVYVLFRLHVTHSVAETSHSTFPHYNKLFFVHFQPGKLFSFPCTSSNICTIRTIRNESLIGKKTWFFTIVRTCCCIIQAIQYTSFFLFSTRPLSGFSLNPWSQRTTCLSVSWFGCFLLGIFLEFSGFCFHSSIFLSLNSSIVISLFRQRCWLKSMEESGSQSVSPCLAIERGYERIQKFHYRFSVPNINLCDWCEQGSL